MKPERKRAQSGSSKPTDSRATGKPKTTKPAAKAGRASTASPTKAGANKPKPADPQQPKAANRKAPERKAAPPPQPQPPRRPAKPQLQVPQILLTGDLPSLLQGSGPGDRYVLGPDGSRLNSASGGSRLPDSYDTGRLWLVARDPHWLYAHWDLTAKQAEEAATHAAHGTLALLIHKDSAANPPLTEIQIPADARSWFVHVEQAGARYLASLAIRSATGRWKTLLTSRATLCPPDSPSNDSSFELQAVPQDVPIGDLVQIIKNAALDHLPLTAALAQLRQQGHAALPPAPPRSPQDWTPAQEAALTELISIDEVRRLWLGSLEITEWARRQLQQKTQRTASLSSAGLAAGPGGPGQPASATPSRPTEALSSLGALRSEAARSRGFWLQVNAELVIYGATDPRARVTLGGRPVALRPDGTFSFRFALPDGEFPLPIEAVSPDGVETRAAALKFSRTTAYHGHVAPHPQDPDLPPPDPRRVTRG